MADNANEINRAVDVLRKGGIILYPTDTIWGLGCDANNVEAIAKIQSLKQRSDEKSMIILLDQDNKIQRYVKDVPEVAWDLIDNAVSPLTIIYPGAKNLPASLIASDGSIAIRIVTEGFCHELLRRFGKPLISTSANISGEPSPENFSQINPALIQGVDYCVDSELEKGSGLASSIIQLELSGKFKIIRK